eukprot:1736470-Pyramimonas_sp.AAC.2
MVDSVARITTLLTSKLYTDSIGIAMLVAPTAEELDAFRTHQGDPGLFSRPEAFLAGLARVPRVAAKLQCLLFVRTFAGQCAELALALACATRATKQV